MPTKKVVKKQPQKQVKKTKVAKRSTLKKGSKLSCNVCGMVVTVDALCDCVETCDLICCDEPMKVKK